MKVPMPYPLNLTFVKPVNGAMRPHPLEVNATVDSDGYADINEVVMLTDCARRRLHVRSGTRLSWEIIDALPQAVEEFMAHCEEMRAEAREEW